METNDNMRKLFDMLDNPGQYTDDEIRRIIDCDPETRDMYETMVMIKRSSRNRSRVVPQASHRKWQAKHVAALVGLVSTLAVAAVVVTRSLHGGEPAEVAAVMEMNDGQHTGTADTIRTDTAGVVTVTFDNIPLTAIAHDIAKFYNMSLVVRNDRADSLRFYFVWYKEQPLGKVVESLNRFESVNMIIDNDRLIVE